MVSDEEYDKIEDAILAGKPVSVPKKLMINEPPKKFTNFLEKNAERIDGWKSKPYWISDNKKYI